MSTDEKTHASERRGARPRLSVFARRLSAEWRRRAWPERGRRVIVAVSGGADSTALLLAFGELIGSGRLDLDVTAAHFNHGLRGEASGEDARWVAELARTLGFESVVGGADVRARAGRENLEQAARRARYGFLHEAALAGGACAVLTAHTLDDQAETILLRLMRGSGAEGLTGMRPERPLVEGREEVKLLRPLVAWARRADTEGYCRERDFSFRLDEMNEDDRFARVRVRKRLLPLVETFNPRAVEALARTAELLSDDAAALDAEAGRLLEEARAEESDAGENDAGAVRQDRESAPPLRVEVLAAAPPAVRRRALRRWIAQGRGDLRRVGLVHVRAVEKLLEGVRGGRIAELPGGVVVERRQGRLRFNKKAEAG